jgi:hypothetical protein
VTPPTGDPSSMLALDSHANPTPGLCFGAVAEMVEMADAGDGGGEEEDASEESEGPPPRTYCLLLLQ